MSFTNAFATTMQHEQGYTNNPKRTGATRLYMAIARTKHPQWPDWPIIDACLRAKRPLSMEPGLTDLVRTYYFKEFWQPLSVTALYRLRRHNDGFKTAAADLINGDGGNFQRDACFQHCLTGWILFEDAREHATKNNLINQFWFDASSFQGFPDNDSAKFHCGMFHLAKSWVAS